MRTRTVNLFSITMLLSLILAPVSGAGVHGRGHAQALGERVDIDGGFTLYGDDADGMALGQYAPDDLRPIESQLRYSTFFASTTIVNAMVLDDAGNVYVTGYTDSLDFPTTPGAYDEGHHDGFVSVLDPTLSDLRYSTSLGGVAYAIALDDAGNVYVTGYTSSDDFPTTPGAYDETYNGEGEYVSDVFVSVLDPTLSNLRYSTFLGGSRSDWGSAIAVDGEGNVHLTGISSSDDFPTTVGAYQERRYGAVDGFVSVLDPTLSTLSYSTLLGGSSDDQAYAIALDRGGNVYVVGQTWSRGFPTTAEAYDRTHDGWSDAFVSVLDPTLSSLQYSTFLGEAINDRASGIALASGGNVYVTGSGRVPTTPGAYDGRGGAFVTVLDPTLTILSHSASLGPGSPSAIELDGAGQVYVTGITSKDYFPTTAGAYDETHNGGTDVFASVLDLTLSTLRYSTFLGGSEDDTCNAMALARAGRVYVTGKTHSNDFPTTPGAYDETYHEGREYNGFVSMLVTGTELYSIYLPVVLR